MTGHSGENLEIACGPVVNEVSAVGCVISVVPPPFLKISEIGLVARVPHVWRLVVAQRFHRLNSFVWWWLGFLHAPRGGNKGTIKGEIRTKLVSSC